MAAGHAVVWQKLEGRPASRWLWSPRVDLFWIAGGGFFLFVLAAFPLSFVAGSGAILAALFLHLGIICNYPHYAATYEVIWRERNIRPRPWNTLLFSAPVMLAMIVVVARVPDLFWGPVVRLYLCWSAHHYAAQNFGVSAMYAARGGRPLGKEKPWLQFAFLGLGMFFILASNTPGGDPKIQARVIGLASDASIIPIAGLPHFVYPLAMALVIVCVGSFLMADRVRRRSSGGEGLDRGAWLLFVTTLAWFVVPNIRTPSGQPWMWEGLSLALVGAPPFFHCAQYLAVCGHRDRTTADIRPIVVFAALVFGGYALFTAPPEAVFRLFPIDHTRAVLLIVTAINLHHFWLDGVMWKSPKKAVAPMAAAVPAPAASAS